MAVPRDFIPIDLAIVRIDTLKPFDIYLRVHDEGYVLYSRKGARFTAAVRRKLLDNRVSTIYVPSGDRDIYQQYVEDNLPHIMRDPAIAAQKKSRIMYASSTYLMEKLFENPRADMIARTQKTVRHIVDLILSDEKTTRQLIRLTEFDYYTYTHSINVGIFSVAFARSLLQGLSERTHHDLGLGFFFHDIGKAMLPPEILNKPGPLTEEEWKVMKTHPELGGRMLERSGLFVPDTIAIVLQHHERPDGTGYPRGLRGDSIPVYSRICSLADVFDAMTTRRCYQAEFSAFEALKIIRDRVLPQESDRNFYEAFVRLFGPDAAPAA